MGFVLFGEKAEKPAGVGSWRAVTLEREREGLKKVLGFQVRPAGAPGPLTLKEVEELEQLTQKLMQDMEHPQKQSVPVNGESPLPLRFQAIPRLATLGLVSDAS